MDVGDAFGFDESGGFFSGPEIRDASNGAVDCISVGVEERKVTKEDEEGKGDGNARIVTKEDEEGKGGGNAGKAGRTTLGAEVFVGVLGVTLQITVSVQIHFVFVAENF